MAGDRRAEANLGRDNAVITTLAGAVQEEHHGELALAIVAIRQEYRVLAFAMAGLERAQVEARRGLARSGRDRKRLDPDVLELHFHRPASVDLDGDQPVMRDRRVGLAVLDR